LVALLVVTTAFVAHAVYLAVVAEDAFISFRYATHLAEGHGLVWNLGEAPVEGYTNFLWVILCAGAIALGRDVTFFAQVAGVFAGVLTIIYAWKFGRRVMRLGPAAALVPCALLALSGPFATWASSGMETILFALAITAASYHASMFALDRRAGEMGSASAFLLLATLTRPEGLLVAVVVLALALRGGRGRYLLPVLALYAVPVAIYWAWRVGYFGDWLPNTYYAKVSGIPLRPLWGMVYAGAFVLYYVVPVALVALLVPRERPRNPGTVLCLSLLVVYTAYVAWVGGDYMAMYRFFAPVVPLMYLLVGRAATLAWSRRRSVTFALVTIGAVITFVHSTPIDRKLFRKPPRQHGHYSGVQTERWHSARLTLLGNYFRSVADDDASLATDAIGAVSYYSRLPVFGFHGLVDRRIARSTAGSRAGLGLPGHEKGDLLYIFTRNPKFIMFSRLFTDEALGGYPDNLEPEVEAVLRRSYQPLSVWLDDPDNGESGYFTYYARTAPRDKTRRSP
jgi:hypothetical protein